MRRVLAIAGVPPLTGYASLGLIHTGVEQQPAVYGALVLAQVVTVAALGRAAYLGFYRRRRRVSKAGISGSMAAILPAFPKSRCRRSAATSSG